MMRGAKRDRLDPKLDHFDVETARELILPVALALDYLHHKVGSWVCGFVGWLVGWLPSKPQPPHATPPNTQPHPTQLVVHLDVKLDNIMLRLAPPEAGAGPQGRERAVLRDPETGRLAVKVSGCG